MTWWCMVPILVRIGTQPQATRFQPWVPECYRSEVTRTASVVFLDILSLPVNWGHVHRS
jgi:hypothetical protein